MDNGHIFPNKNLPQQGQGGVESWQDTLVVEHSKWQVIHLEYERQDGKDTTPSFKVRPGAVSEAKL